MSEWNIRRAINEAKVYAAQDYRAAAWVFRLADSSYGWANCHPSWGWLRDDERAVAAIYCDGTVEAIL